MSSSRMEHERKDDRENRQSVRSKAHPHAPPITNTTDGAAVESPASDVTGGMREKAGEKDKNKSRSSASSARSMEIRKTRSAQPSTVTPFILPATKTSVTTRSAKRGLETSEASEAESEGLTTSPFTPSTPFSPSVANYDEEEQNMKTEPQSSRLKSKKPPVFHPRARVPPAVQPGPLAKLTEEIAQIPSHPQRQRRRLSPPSDIVKTERGTRGAKGRAMKGRSGKTGKSIEIAKARALPKTAEFDVPLEQITEVDVDVEEISIEDLGVPHLVDRTKLSRQLTPVTTSVPVSPTSISPLSPTSPAVRTVKIPKISATKGSLPAPPSEEPITPSLGGLRVVDPQRAPILAQLNEKASERLYKKHVNSSKSAMTTVHNILDSINHREEPARDAMMDIIDTELIAEEGTGDGAQLTEKAAKELSIIEPVVEAELDTEAAEATEEALGEEISTTSSIPSAHRPIIVPTLKDFTEFRAGLEDLMQRFVAGLDTQMPSSSVDYPFVEAVEPSADYISDEVSSRLRILGAFSNHVFYQDIPALVLRSALVLGKENTSGLGEQVVWRAVAAMLVYLIRTDFISSRHIFNALIAAKLDLDGEEWWLEVENPTISAVKADISSSHQKTQVPTSTGLEPSAQSKIPTHISTKLEKRVFVPSMHNTFLFSKDVRNFTQRREQHQTKQHVPRAQHHAHSHFSTSASLSQNVRFTREEMKSFSQLLDNYKTYFLHATMNPPSAVKGNVSNLPLLSRNERGLLARAFEDWLSVGEVLEARVVLRHAIQQSLDDFNVSAEDGASMIHETASKVETELLQNRHQQAKSKQKEKKREKREKTENNTSGSGRTYSGSTRLLPQIECEIAAYLVDSGSRVGAEDRETNSLNESLCQESREKACRILALLGGDTVVRVDVAEHVLASAIYHFATDLTNRTKQKQKQTLSMPESGESDESDTESADLASAFQSFLTVHVKNKGYVDGEVVLEKVSEMPIRTRLLGDLVARAIMDDIASPSFLYRAKAILPDTPGQGVLFHAGRIIEAYHLSRQACHEQEEEEEEEGDFGSYMGEGEDYEKHEKEQGESSEEESVTDWEREAEISMLSE